MVTIFSALAHGTAYLRDKGVDTPRLDSEVLLAHLLGWERLKLVTERGSALRGDVYREFQHLLELRAKGMPVAYLVGYKEFMGLDFIVAPGVLIPRGDTEILVERVIEECKKYPGPLHIVDVGCGSGAIGISIAKYAGNAYVTLIDISHDALKISKQNAAKNGVESRVKVVCGDLLSTLLNEKFDIVVSNPPYIESHIIDSLQREVKDYEPHLALDGGEDGLEFYRAITSQASECLKEGGLLAYEIGCDQAESVKNIMLRNGFGDVQVFKDLAGLDRCLVARKV